MSISDAIAVASAAAAIAAALYARNSAKATRRATERARKAHDTSLTALRVQVLFPLIQTYQSAEMFVAVRSLWSFARTNKDRLHFAARDQFAKERALVDAAEPEERVELTRSTLDYQRRLVKHFYVYLATLIDEEAESRVDDLNVRVRPLRELVYRHWMKYDFQIIPDVLLPIEHAQASANGIPVADVVTEKLQRLFQNAPDVRTSDAQISA